MTPKCTPSSSRVWRGSSPSPRTIAVASRVHLHPRPVYPLPGNHGPPGGGARRLRGPPARLPSPQPVGDIRAPDGLVRGRLLHGGGERGGLSDGGVRRREAGRRELRAHGHGADQGQIEIGSFGRDVYPVGRRVQAKSAVPAARVFGHYIGAQRMR